MKSFINPASAHDPLPTERELQEQFGVSRDTVRRAVSVLQQKGLVYNVQGSGTYVADTKSRSKEPRILAYSEDMLARGFSPSTATIGINRVVASEEVARNLGLLEGSPVIEVVRIRRANEEPMCFEKARFITEAFEDVHPETNSSIDQQLTEGGFRIERMSERVSAVNLNYEEAAALAVAPHTAGLKIERVGYTARGKAVESTLSVYRADRYNLEFDLSRP